MLDIGQYWTKIRVTDPWRDDAHEYLQDYLVQVVLRSGSHPLDVIWSFYYPSKSQDMSKFDKLLKVAPTSRWKSLRIKHAMVLPEDALGHGFPILETLESVAGFDQIEDIILRTLDQSSLKLAELSVSCVWELAVRRFPNATRRIISFRTTNPLYPIPTLPSNITALDVDSFYSEPSIIFPSIKSLYTSHPFKGPEKVPNLQWLSLEVCSEHECHYGRGQDLMIGAFCEDRVNYLPSGNPNDHPFPKLISMTARVCCEQRSSDTPDERPKYVESWKECALSILARRKGSPLEYIEFIWEEFDFAVRYDKSLVVES
jgi:hypothetical protein